jgi:hypothetical protein
MGYYTTFNAPDMEFLDPLDDRNVDKEIFYGINLAVVISDRNYTDDQDAMLIADFYDKGIQ